MYGNDIFRNRSGGHPEQGPAAAVLLAAFAVVETRSRHALLPVRLLRQRDRLGANLIMLGVGTANFGVFFFVTFCPG